MKNSGLAWPCTESTRGHETLIAHREVEENTTAPRVAYL